MNLIDKIARKALDLVKNDDHLGMGESFDQVEHVAPYGVEATVRFRGHMKEDGAQVNLRATITSMDDVFVLTSLGVGNQLASVAPIPEKQNYWVGEDDSGDLVFALMQGHRSIEDAIRAYAKDDSLYTGRGDVYAFPATEKIKYEIDVLVKPAEQ